MTNARAADLSGYLPVRVVRQIALESPPREGAIADAFVGAVLFTDISGFTALTESLALRGPVGAEELTRCLNVYFGQLIDLIVGAGGDIVKFAGDALLAVWPADGDDVATALCRAAECGLTAQERLHDFQATADIRLSLRVGIAAGPLTLLHVGGVDGRRELVATGAPLQEMAEAAARVQPGQVGMSSAAAALVANRVEVETVAAGVARVCHVVRAADPHPATPPIAVDPRALLPYLPPSVVDQEMRGGTTWLAELRPVTVLFVNFPNLTPSTPLERSQGVMCELQSILHRFEGTINKLSLDDKGASLVAAMGLPPLLHEDDAERAVRAALAIRDRLDSMQVVHSIGIATGLAFCGIVGNATRREYTMIGDVVNLAARLMQAAHGGVLCNHETYDAARARLAFEALPSIHVKGKAGDIAVYRPAAVPLRAIETRAQWAPTVGRCAELAAIDQHVRAVAARGDGAVIVFTGMAGIGKSQMLEELRRSAERADVTWFDTHGDAMEKATPFYAWRAVFDRAYHLEAMTDADERQRHVLTHMTPDRRQWIERLPLANPVLRTNFPQTEATAAMNDQARAAATYELLADLALASSSDGSPRILIFDNAHWMDSASLALAGAVQQRGGAVLMAFAARPIPGPALEQIETMSRSPLAMRFDLGPLDTDDVIAIASRKLGVEPPEPVEAILRSKADGNALLAQELVAALVEGGYLEVVGGNARLPRGADLRGVDLPGSVQAAVAARIDRVPPSQRLLLKFASVVGRVFDVDVLSELAQGHADVASLDADLRSLEAAGIVRLERTEPTRAYAFTHLAFQEVAYRQMLFSQRRQLHQRMTDVLERRTADDEPTLLPQLAFHARRAIDDSAADPGLVWKAIDYLHRAGARAIQQFANQDAVELLDGALELIEKLPDSEARARKELALCCAVGAPLLVTKGFAAPETARAYSRASELCQQIENSPEQFGAVYGLWGFALMSTQLERARGLAAEVFRVAEASGDPELLLPANRAVGDTAFWLGDLVTARRHLEKAMELYRPEHHATEVFRTGQDQGIVSASLSSWAVWLLGYPDTALKRMEDTLASSQRLGHEHTTAMTFQNYTMTLQFRGNAAAVLENAEPQMALTREKGFPLWLAGAMVMRGWARATLGAVEEGIAELRQGIDGWRATGAELAVPYYFGLLAERLAAAGRVDAGLAAIDQGLASSNRSGESWWRPELFRLQAELHLQLETPNGFDVERRLLEALELARSQQSRSLELRAAMSLYRFWMKGGNRAGDARAPLAEVAGWFTEGFDTEDLRHCRLYLMPAS